MIHSVSSYQSSASRGTKMTTNTIRRGAAGVVCLLLSLVDPAAGAAGDQALVKKVAALDAAATAAYADGDFDEMKKHLTKAQSLGAGTLDAQPIMARVYLHLGVLHVDGLDNRPAGVKFFARALKVKPDIQLTSNMATKTVKSAFAEAGRQAPASGTSRAAASSANGDDGAGDRNKKVEREAHSGRLAALPGTAPERCRGSAELADVKRQARDEFDRLEKALSMTKDALNKERADSEKFRKQSIEFDRALGDAKQRVAQLENEGKQKDKRIAASAQREKKEHDATEALEREKVDKDSLILDTAQRVQELEKQTAEKDKQIAALAQREKKEREAREKLEQERQAAESRERERKAWEERVRAERDKLEAGPPLPSRIPEPLHCSVPEEVQGGVDLFVQCVAQPGIKAKVIVFYYRPPSSTFYNAVVMDPTRRGWSRAVITANKVSGKLLQYYAEVRDGNDSVAATNGKATSPNVVTVTAANHSPR